MAKVELRLSLEFWEIYGSSTLKGYLFSNFPDIKLGSEVYLKFEETTIEYRKRNNGPKTLIAPEFMPKCFSEDLIWLCKNFDVTLGTYNLHFSVESKS